MTYHYLIQVPDSAAEKWLDVCRCTNPDGAVAILAALLKHGDLIARIQVVLVPVGPPVPPF